MCRGSFESGCQAWSGKGSSDMRSIRGRSVIGCLVYFGWASGIVLPSRTSFEACDSESTKSPNSGDDPRRSTGAVVRGRYLDWP